METIHRFDGPYRFLSNFYPADIFYDYHKYKSVEHAYQASKTFSNEQRFKIEVAPTAAAAKQLGQHVSLRPNWDILRLPIMESLIRQKFAIPALRTLLIDTRDAEIVEGNWWHDTYWGVCNGKGLNHLGRLLMLVREELK